MKQLPKVAALLTARNSHSARGGVGLTAIFREARRGLKRFVVYVELAELMLGRRTHLKLELVDEHNELVWDYMETEEINRLRTGAWMFYMQGAALKAGAYALYLYFNGTILDVRNLQLE
jgi:hypothetical protein